MFLWALCCYRGKTIAGAPTWAKESAVKRLFREAFPGRHPRLFPGVVLSDIPPLEQRFQLDINIFELSCGDGKTRGKIILRGEGLFKTDHPLSLIAFQGHFCLIKKVCWQIVCNQFQCSKCRCVFKCGCNFNKHEKLQCDKSIKTTYVGGVYHPQLNVFARLADANLSLPEGQDGIFLYHITFDFASSFS